MTDTRFRTDAWSLQATVLRNLFFCAAVVLVAACATLGRDVVDHGFGFDLRGSDQDAVVLEYWYGRPDSPVRAPRPYDIETNRKAFATAAVTGPMRRPEALYVKWQNRYTGQVYEDTVKLRDRLPANFTGQILYFTIKGPQLYVYLVSQEKRPEGMPANGPDLYRHRKVITLYPE